VFDHRNKQDLSESKLLGKLSVTNRVFFECIKKACCLVLLATMSLKTPLTTLLATSL